MVEKIKKRDGHLAEFNPEKIKSATEKAFLADGILGNDAIMASQRVTDKVVTRLDMMFNGTSQPYVEQVQDLVEDTMMELGYLSTAKKYILYREMHKEKREMDQSKQAIFDFAKKVG